MCDARIRPFRPINETELGCELVRGHVQHASTLRDYAYPGSKTTISWSDTDRRIFRSEFAECPTDRCILPAEHRGAHTR